MDAHGGRGKFANLSIFLADFATKSVNLSNANFATIFANMPSFLKIFPTFCEKW